MDSQICRIAPGLYSPAINQRLVVGSTTQLSAQFTAIIDPAVDLHSGAIRQKRGRGAGTAKVFQALSARRKVPYARQLPSQSVTIAPAGHHNLRKKA